MRLKCFLYVVVHGRFFGMCQHTHKSRENAGGRTSLTFTEHKGGSKVLIRPWPVPLIKGALLQVWPWNGTAALAGWVVLLDHSFRGRVLPSEQSFSGTRL
jgi:hypothetical protein